MSTYREEERADRAQAAQLRQQAETAAAQNRLAEKRVVGEQRRLDRIAERDQVRLDRKQKQLEREEKRAAAADWFRARWLDLLFVPVIVVPAILAWTAMAAYGSNVFGPVGWGLPIFSEGAMWVFAAATTITRRRDGAAPVWHLQLGTTVFAAIAAALNMIHGLSAPGTGVGDATVMALVSIGGVVVHQLVSAGPRRTRVERADAAIARQVAKRELAVRRAATRVAIAELDEQGKARLLYRAGTVMLQRRPLGRPVLVDAILPARPVPVTADGEHLAVEIGRFLTSPEAAVLAVAGNGPDPSGTAETSPDGAAQDGAEDTDGNAGNERRFAVFVALLDQARAAIAEGELDKRPSRRQVRKVLRCRQDMAGDVHKALLADQDDDGDDGDKKPVAA
jgi:hypothetical protein